MGSVEALTLLVNDREARLPAADAVLASAPDEVVELKGGPPHPPLTFKSTASPLQGVSFWRLAVAKPDGDPLHVVEGEGAPPPLVVWNSDQEERELQGGEIYRYRMESRHSDGSTADGPYRLFGLNRSSAVSLNLTGSAFESGSDVLSRKAREILKQTAVVLRRHAEEKVLVEGHTDSVGSEESNLDLSRRRSEAAAAFLIGKEGIPKERIAVRWFGESRPIASNDIPEGRELNRRVEIKGEYLDTRRAQILDQHRQAPLVAVNGARIDTIDPQGRFTASIAAEQGRIEIEMGNSSGRFLKSVLPLPTLHLSAPASGALRVPYPCSAQEFSGVTEVGNSLTLDGEEVKVAKDGSFTLMLAPQEGTATHWLLLRNSEGYSREYRLNVSLSREAKKRSP